MDHQTREHNIIRLSVLGVLGIAYSSWLHYRGTLTGMNHVDGIVGVVFGLYICSNPAANLVDLFFYGGDRRRRISSKGSTVLWLALNLLVLLIGGIVIFSGVTRFIGRIDRK